MQQTYKRPYNFSPGPSVLPEEVLIRAQGEMLNWRNTGVSIMELSHRTEIFLQFVRDLEQKIRVLMNVPNNYKILFLAGGAQGQFAAIPMNLTRNNRNVDYFATGIWSERAISYAEKYSTINVVTRATKSAIPDKSTWNLNKNAAY